MVSFMYSANAYVQIATPLEKGPKTEQQNDLTRNFRSLLASDTMDGR